MKRTKWFHRKFDQINDNVLFPCIIERLEGTTCRLLEKIKTLENLTSSHSQDGMWSIKKEIGHLIDLEPLWFTRFQEIVDNKRILTSADLENNRTHLTDHDGFEYNELIANFKNQRTRMVTLLKSLNEEALLKSSRHPRLGTTMRVVDLAYFVAEHDDHHLAQITTLLQRDTT